MIRRSRGQSPHYGPARGLPERPGLVGWVGNGNGDGKTKKGEEKAAGPLSPVLLLVFFSLSARLQDSFSFQKFLQNRDLRLVSLGGKVQNLGAVVVIPVITSGLCFVSSPLEQIGQFLRRYGSGRFKSAVPEHLDLFDRNPELASVCEISNSGVVVITTEIGEVERRADDESVDHITLVLCHMA